MKLILVLFNNMKKLLYIIVFAITIFAGYRSIPLAQAALQGEGYINMWSHPGGHIDPACDPSTDSQKCNQYHPLAKNCSPSGKYCDGGDSKDIPEKKRWVFKFVCDGKTHNCDTGLVQKGEGVKSSIGTPGCGKTVQIDVFDKDCEAGGGWSCNGADDYMVYYTGACPAASPSPSPSISPEASPSPQASPSASPSPQASPSVTQPPGGTTPSVTPSTVTPTPDFSEAMCKCDGMTVSQIISGQQAVFTANAKVEGSDISKAQVKSMTFALYEGNNISSTKVIEKSDPIAPTITSQTASKVQYQSQWSFTIPDTVKKGVDYRAQAQIKCERKTTAQLLPFTATVMGASTEQRGLFEIILNFFASIFSTDTGDSTGTTPTSTPVAQDDLASIAESNLQLDSFSPAQVTQRSCNLIKFRF